MRLDHLLSKEKEEFLSRKIYCLFFNVLLKRVHCYLKYGGVAQLARAPALQAGGQEFDSLCLHHNNYLLIVAHFSTLKNI